MADGPGEVNNGRPRKRPGSALQNCPDGGVVRVLRTEENNDRMPAVGEQELPPWLRQRPRVPKRQAPAAPAPAPAAPTAPHEGVTRGGKGRRPRLQFKRLQDGGDVSTGEGGTAGANRSRWRYLPILLLALAAAAVFATGLNRYFRLDALISHRDLLQDFVAAHRIGALLLYMLVYVGAVTLSIPGAAFLTVLGGFLFGWLVGGAAAAVSATVGADLRLPDRPHLDRRRPRPARRGPGAGDSPKASGRTPSPTCSSCAFCPWCRSGSPISPRPCSGCRCRPSISPPRSASFRRPIAFAVAGSGLDSVIAAQHRAQEACLAAGGARLRLRAETEIPPDARDRHRLRGLEPSRSRSGRGEAALRAAAQRLRPPTGRADRDGPWRRRLTPDLCVIGAGSGGLSVAAIAASFGVPVVLDREGPHGRRVPERRLRALEGADRRGGAPARGPVRRPLRARHRRGAGRSRPCSRPSAGRDRGDRPERFRRALRGHGRQGDPGGGTLRRSRDRRRRRLRRSGRGASSSPSARTPRCRPSRASPAAVPHQRHHVRSRRDAARTSSSSAAARSASSSPRPIAASAPP